MIFTENCIHSILYVIFLKEIKTFFSTIAKRFRSQTNKVGDYFTVFFIFKFPNNFFLIVSSNQSHKHLLVSQIL